VLTADLHLNGRYRLDHPLAAGGMGEVWRATDVVLGRTVAVKVLLPALLTDPEFGRRFEAEARMMASLRHPGIVDVFDYGEADLPTGGKVAYLVMECVDGQPLSERLAAGRLDQARTLAVVSQVARALHVAHRHGIVHRDVKPGNLLVETDGTVRLVDFGIARSTAVTAQTAGQVVGTALYIAPEQAAGQPVSAATDVYALGAVAYHCLAGTPPYTGDNPVAVAARHIYDEPPPLPDDIDPRVRALVGRAMAKEPADRYPTAAAFAAAVRRTARDLGDGSAAALAVTDRRLAGLADPAATAPVVGRTPAGPDTLRMAAVGRPTRPDADPDDGRTTGDEASDRRPMVAAASGVLLALILVAVWIGLGDGPSTPANPPARTPGPDRAPATAPATTGVPGPGAPVSEEESTSATPTPEPDAATTPAATPPPEDDPPPPDPDPTGPPATSEPEPTSIEDPGDPGEGDPGEPAGAPATGLAGGPPTGPGVGPAR
jgi:serine/threonine-protein kinase